MTDDDDDDDDAFTTVLRDMPRSATEAPIPSSQ